MGNNEIKIMTIGELKKTDRIFVVPFRQTNFPGQSLCNYMLTIDKNEFIKDMESFGIEKVYVFDGLNNVLLIHITDDCIFKRSVTNG